MNEILRPAGILLAITVVASGLLGVVSEVTAEQIAIQEEKTQTEAMQAVYPDADAFTEIELTEEQTSTTVTAAYEASSGGELIGYVVNVAPNGYGGAVSTMVGVDLEGVVTGIKVVSHSETAGLGARATEEGEGSFASQFAGKSGSNLAVTKDGGDIEAITSATITSRAVTTGVNDALNLVSEIGGAN